MNNLTPIKETERLSSLDIMRGFAILGIFLVNMAAFNSPVLYLETGMLWSDSFSIGTETFVDIFAQASFYTLFSFLFGYGMVIFKERVEVKGLSFHKYMIKRLLLLLAVGCIHAFLIWHGDILMSYALIGFLLLFFLRLSVKALTIWALSIIIVSTFFSAVLLAIVMMITPDASSITNNESIVQHSLAVYSSGSFIEITQQRFQDWYYVNNPLNYIFLTVSILPMFLLGAVFAKAKLFLGRNEKKRRYLLIVLLVSLFLGIIFKGMPYYIGENLLTEFLQDSVGGPASAIAYVISIFLIVNTGIGWKIFKPLRFVGRASLSNYLLQSFICTTLFYSYGFGLYGTFSPFHGLILTIGIFLIQILISKIWFSYYLFGPVEWVWRVLTYGTIGSIKKRERGKI